LNSFDFAFGKSSRPGPEWHHQLPNIVIDESSDCPLFLNQNFHVYLDVITRHLFSIAAGVDCPPVGISEQETDSIAFESAVNA